MQTYPWQTFFVSVRFSPTDGTVRFDPRFNRCVGREARRVDTIVSNDGAGHWLLRQSRLLNPSRQSGRSRSIPSYSMIWPNRYGGRYSQLIWIMRKIDKVDTQSVIVISVHRCASSGRLIPRSVNCTPSLRRSANQCLVLQPLQRA